MTLLHIVSKFDGVASDEYQASFFLDLTPDYTAPFEGEVKTVIKAWLESMFGRLTARVTIHVAGNEYTVYERDLITGEDSWLFDGVWTWIGTNVSETLPPQVSATCSMHVTGGNRPAQKRLIPFGEDTQAHGIWTAATVADMALMLADWIVAWPPSATYTYIAGIPSGAAPQTFRPASGTGVARGTTGTARSRKRGLGI